MMVEEVEEELRGILGGTYGGPSLSVGDSDQFIIYMWYDAPVGEEIMAQGLTIRELVRNFKRDWKIAERGPQKGAWVRRKKR